MKKRLLSALIAITTLIIGQSVFAEAEEEVVVITNVPYSASLTKKASNESATVDPANGTHSGMSSVITLQTNGGDDHFDYILTSQIVTQSGAISAYTNDGKLLFAHQAVPPTSAAVENAKSGTSTSKNVFAYPVSISTTGSLTSAFMSNYKTYGNCHAIFVNADDTSGDVTYNVLGTPVTNTYEAGLDEAGSYRSTVSFTIISK